jgi:hypothetical protein
MAVTKTLIESGAQQPKNIMISVGSKSQMRKEESGELRQIFINSAQLMAYQPSRQSICSNSTDP